jgi:hypothetical protein
MSDHIAANVSSELSHQINRKLLGEVCMNLFGTTNVEYVRDVFHAVQQDPDIQDRVVAIRTARRIGVK